MESNGYPDSTISISKLMVRFGEWSAGTHAPLAVNGLKHTKLLSVLKGTVGLQDCFEVWLTKQNFP